MNIYSCTLKHFRKIFQLHENVSFNIIAFKLYAHICSIDNLYYLCLNLVLFVYFVHFLLHLINVFCHIAVSLSDYRDKSNHGNNIVIKDNPKTLNLGQSSDKEKSIHQLKNTQKLLMKYR